MISPILLKDFYHNHITHNNYISTNIIGMAPASELIQFFIPIFRCDTLSYQFSFRHLNEFEENMLNFKVILKSTPLLIDLLD